MYRLLHLSITNGSSLQLFNTQGEGAGAGTVVMLSHPLLLGKWNKIDRVMTNLFVAMTLHAIKHLRSRSNKLGSTLSVCCTNHALPADSVSLTAQGSSKQQALLILQAILVLQVMPILIYCICLGTLGHSVCKLYFYAETATSEVSRQGRSRSLSASSYPSPASPGINS